MRYLFRLRWDELYTPWQPVPQEYIQALADEGTLLSLIVNPAPTKWRFDAEIMDILRDIEGYQVAVESTRIEIQIKGVK